MITVEVSNGKVKIRQAKSSDICEAVLTIVSIVPIGRVVSYKAIGDLLGVHPRVVASCVKHNKTPIVTPCHRVVYRKGKIGGYAFGGERVKTRILMIEGALTEGARRIGFSNFYDLKWLIK